MILKLMLTAILILGVGNIGQFLLNKYRTNRLQTQLVELQRKNLEQEMLIKAKDKEMKYAEATAHTERRVVYVHREIDKVVDSSDNTTMHRLYIEHGMLPSSGEAGASTGRNTGNSKHPSPTNP